MGSLRWLIVVSLSWVIFITNTHQLQTYETQLLLQIRRQLEYPLPLQVLENYNGDLCNMSPTPHMSLTCESDSVSELKIKGDKLLNVSEFHGYAIPPQTLSPSFSIDSFVTTLTRLTNLRVLSLVSLGIWGPLPDKIHRLSSLELFDMSSNFMFGSIPPQISTLVRLHTLTLDSNFFNGTVPNWFDSLSNLTLLSLKNNRLKGSFPPSICRVATFTGIALSHNKLSGELPDMSNLTSLHLLDLRENQFDCELPLLPIGLTTVLLSNNLIHGKIPKQLSYLNHLQHLDLSFNRLTGAPPVALFSLPNISYLNLASNLIGGLFPNKLSCGAELGFVDISNNRLMGSLPSCLGTTLDKRVVKFGGNCLSIVVDDSQHQQSYCGAYMDKERTKGKAIWVLIGVIGGIVTIVVLLALIGLLISYKLCSCSRGGLAVKCETLPKTRIDDNIKPTGISSQLLANARIISQAAKLGTQGAHHVYRVFTLEDLEEATNDFEESALLGDGSIGKLYKGRLESGAYVAIRCIRLFRKYPIKNLKLRLDLLSKIQHPNLVSLLGHCIDEGADSTAIRLFLVYEYLPNANFRAHLCETNGEKVLDWSDRLGILIGVAKAVHFLHTGVISASFSNQLKTNNILFTEHRIAKLSEYGMSIIIEEIEKSEGKGDCPKSWKHNRTIKVVKEKDDDVYNFGLILLESLVGQSIVSNGKGEAFLLNEMASSLGEGSEDGIKRIVDPLVVTTCSAEESLSRVISITQKCISPAASGNRPSFEDVLWNLQYAAQLNSSSARHLRSSSSSAVST